MFDVFKKKTDKKINVTETIDFIEKKVYDHLKPLGFKKYGRTLHRFVDLDISQVINFQCGQAYRKETHLMWVNVGIRIPECSNRDFASDELLKKYYHEYECTIRSALGTVTKSKESCYNLKKDDINKIISDILFQIDNYVLPAFQVLNSRSAILKNRRNYPEFDVTNGHLILLEEAMIYGKMGDMANATLKFNEHYKKCVGEKNPVSGHIKLLEALAKRLGITLE